MRPQAGDLGERRALTSLNKEDERHAKVNARQKERDYGIRVTGVFKMDSSTVTFWISQH